MDGPSRLGSGRYEVRAVLGAGAQGVTYDAFDHRAGRAVALKRFDVRGARSWKDVELAEREARVLASLDHPLVPRYVDRFEESGQLYLVMEKVEGETLDAIVRRHGPQPEAEVRRFLADADRALTYLHGRASPVVHRDLKPRNVIRRPDGSYVLVDFGAVSELMLRRGSSTVVGTIGYMAPEQLQGRALPATDVYAVGATALAALTGVDPDVLPHRGLRIDARATLQGRVSPALVAALERMLEPDPDRRARSLAEALEGMHGVAGSVPSPIGASGHGAVAAIPFGDSAPPAGPQHGREDALVRSVVKHSWWLGALGCVSVSLVLHIARLSHLFVWVWFAVFYVVTNEAVLRALLRSLGRGSLAGQRPATAIATAHTSTRNRVAVGTDERLGVHASSLHAHELVADTEIGASDLVDARRGHSR